MDIAKAAAKTPPGAPAEKALLLEDGELQNLVDEYTRKIKVLRDANQDLEAKLQSKRSTLGELQNAWTQVDPGQATRINLKHFVDLVAELKDLRTRDERLTAKENEVANKADLRDEADAAERRVILLQERVNNNDVKISSLQSAWVHQQKKKSLEKSRAKTKQEEKQRERLDYEKAKLRRSIQKLRDEISKQKKANPVHRHRDLHLRKKNISASKEAEAKIYDALLAPFANIDLTSCAGASKKEVRQRKTEDTSMERRASALCPAKSSSQTTKKTTKSQSHRSDALERNEQLDDFELADNSGEYYNDDDDSDKGCALSITDHNEEATADKKATSNTVRRHKTEQHEKEEAEEISRLPRRRMRYQQRAKPNHDNARQPRHILEDPLVGHDTTIISDANDDDREAVPSSSSFLVSPCYNNTKYDCGEVDETMSAHLQKGTKEDQDRTTTSPIPPTPMPDKPRRRQGGRPRRMLMDPLSCST